MNNNSSVSSIFRVLIILSIYPMLFIFQSISFRLIPQSCSDVGTESSFQLPDWSLQYRSVQCLSQGTSPPTELLNQFVFPEGLVLSYFFNTHLAERERQIFPFLPISWFLGLVSAKQLCMCLIEDFEISHWSSKGISPCSL